MNFHLRKMHENVYTVHSDQYLYHQGDFFDASNCVSVKRIKGVIPHDWRLKDVTAPPVQHKQSLVHLHRLVCRWKKKGG